MGGSYFTCFFLSRSSPLSLSISLSLVKVMGHGVGHYIGLNEIGSPSPMKTFITINYLFNFIFGFIQ